MTASHSIKVTAAAALLVLGFGLVHGQARAAGALAATPGPVVGISEAAQAAVPARVTLALARDAGTGSSVQGLGIEPFDIIEPMLAAIGLTGEGGVLVQSVNRQSPAGRAGFLAGDLIVAVNGHAVHGFPALAELLAQADPGAVEFQVVRVGEGPADLARRVEASAALGNRDAILALADLRLFGIDKRFTPDSALSLYEQAWGLGDARAAYRLGKAYLEGRGVDIDLAFATHWFRRAAASGFAPAEYELALAWWSGRYWTGLSLVGDPAEAAHLFEQAAAQDYAPAYIYLGLASERGAGVPVDRQAALDWYDRAIAAAVPGALVRRADLLLGGDDHNPADMQEGLALLERAAREGDVESNRRLGLMYLSGDGVSLFPSKALRYFEVAARAGDAGSMLQMAQVLSAGYGVPRDTKRGLDWYFRAYQAGSGDAGYALALAYADGVGVAPDPAKVAGYLVESIRRGSSTALTDLTDNPEGWDLPVRQELQRLLQVSGAYVGAIDGIIGPGTLRALKALAG